MSSFLCKKEKVNLLAFRHTGTRRRFQNNLTIEAKGSTERIEESEMRSSTEEKSGEKEEDGLQFL